MRQNIITAKFFNLLVKSLLSIVLVYSFFGCTDQAGEENIEEDVNKELPVERMSHPGKAAEGYFSPDGKSLIINAKLDNDTAHHTYTFNIDGSNVVCINDVGQDACSYYFPDGKRLVYTSTKDNLDMPKGHWSVPKDYPQGAELYICSLDGSEVFRLTNNKYYDAEVSVSPNGEWILFSRQIEGNLDLWKIKPDGTEETQITHTPDWQEGGSFYMPDSKTILYRAWRTGEKGYNKPMTIFTIKDDGADLKQITDDNFTNWAPHPASDGIHFVFAKKIPLLNPDTSKAEMAKTQFEIFLMNINTGEQTQLTFNDAFDGFPALSPDGKLLTFSSGRDSHGAWELHQYLMDVSSLNIGLGE